jgi:hypothetical protein
MYPVATLFRVVRATMPPFSRLRIPFLLAALTLLAFANAPWGEYCYDDISLIRDRKTIEHWSGMAKLVSRDFGPAFGDLHYRPLAPFTHFADAILFGKKPFFSRLINVALHLAAGLALLGLWRRVFKREILATLAAAIFLCHPVTTEVVNCPGFRKDVLCTLLTVWTVWLLWRCGREGSVRAGIAAAAVWFLGLLAKEPAILAPVLAALLLFFNRDTAHEGEENPRRPRGARFLAPVALAFACAFAAWITLYLCLRPHMTLDYSSFALTKPISEVTPGSLGPALGFLNFCKAFLIYAKLWLVPVGLSVNHYFEPSVSFADWRTWAGAAALAGLFLLSLWAWKKGNPAGVGGLWACICLAPVAQILPAPEWLAERYLYIAHAGIALLIASLILGRETRARRLISLVLLGAYAALTLMRNQDWQDDLTLNVRAYELWDNTEGRVRLGALQTIAAQKALTGPGGTRTSEGAEERARLLREARRNLTQALQEAPERSDAWRTLGTAEWMSGEKDAARVHIRKAFELNPADPLNQKAMELIGEKKPAGDNLSGPAGKSESPAALTPPEKR